METMRKINLINGEFISSEAREILMDLYNGVLIVHLNLEDPYEKREKLLIEFRNGLEQERRIYDNQKFKKFIDAQFELYKTTEEYKESFAELKKLDDKIENEDIDNLNEYVMVCDNSINNEIKCREDFRPFAPVLMKEDVSLYFKHNEDSPYMLWVNEIKSEFRYSLAAVVHENNTSRLQTVTSKDHPLLFRLLQQFKQKSNHGILLNTSFNKRGMPIVETPSDAFDIFINSKIDVLVMDEYAFIKTHAFKHEDDTNRLLDDITKFLNEIGIATSFETIDEPSFLSGILIQNGSLKIDKNKLIYPGDILHEAGHIAVTSSEERESMIGDIGKQKKHDEAYGEEIAAMLWSYAALTHLKLNPEIVFHPNGYKGSSSMFIENFTRGNYIGLPLLSWMGLCNVNVQDSDNEPIFPKMKKWLRD
jgi:hypothetical protein